MRSFQLALMGGQNAERKWCEGIREAGLCIGDGVKVTAEKHNKRTDHITTPDAVALLSIEIKERSIRFTSPEDFPYETVFVDDLRGLSMERIHPFAYVFISKPTGDWVWLTPLDRDRTWKEEETFDRARRHPLPVLVAPKKHLRHKDELLKLLYPHCHLDMVDGETDWLRRGAAASGKCNPEGDHKEAPGRGRKAQGKVNKHVG